MPAVSILFLHGLRENIARHIASYTPQGFDTTILDGDTSVAEQVEAVAAADYLIVYAAPLSDEVLRAARRARLVQLLAAGYDRMNLALALKLKILAQIRAEVGQDQPIQHVHAVHVPGVNVPPRAESYEEWLKQNCLVDLRTA
ncbi:MAG: hypothetical protein VCF24_12050 [Candidatus Latescibacterota bacterium]